MTTFAMPDPGEPFRRDLARIMAHHRAVHDALRSSLPNPGALIAQSAQQALADAGTSQIMVQALDALQREMRKSNVALLASVMGPASIAANATMAEQMSRIGTSVATAAAVRVAADSDIVDTLPEREDAEQPGTLTEEDVRRIVTATVREVTGDRPEGWRWLLCTPVGLATLVTILIGAANLVIACVALANMSSTVNVENSPGATVHVESVGAGTEDPAVSGSGTTSDVEVPPAQQHGQADDGLASRQ